MVTRRNIQAEKEERTKLENGILDFMKKSGYGRVKDRTFQSLLELYKNDEKFKEVYKHGIQISEYDDWIQLEKVLGVKISFEMSLKMSSLLYEEDITVMDLPSREKKEKNIFIYKDDYSEEIWEEYYCKHLEIDNKAEEIKITYSQAEEMKNN